MSLIYGARVTVNIKKKHNNFLPKMTYFHISRKALLFIVYKLLRHVYLMTIALCKSVE